VVALSELQANGQPHMYRNSLRHASRRLLLPTECELEVEPAEDLVTSAPSNPHDFGAIALTASPACLLPVPVSSAISPWSDFVRLLPKLRSGMMKHWLIVLTEHAILVIDAMALLVIAIGTVEALIRGTAVMLASPSGHERRDVWLRYARWLVAGLTFQLAADIVETSITDDWLTIGRLAAIAVIRTFLNFFLERDLNDVRERQRDVTE
jgi:uncharacterized membrane protein